MWLDTKIVLKNKECECVTRAQFPEISPGMHYFQGHGKIWKQNGSSFPRYGPVFGYNKIISSNFACQHQEERN